MEKNNFLINSLFDKQTRYLIDNIYLFDNIDSTNKFLKNKITNKKTNKANICIAKNQTDGIGRRGNHWVSDGQNISFSVSFLLNLKPQQLSNLAIITALICAKVLQKNGFPQIKLKWPNDLIYDDKKLGGILVELQSIKQKSLAIIGIGINAKITNSIAIDQDWIDLTQINNNFSKTKLMVQIIQQLLPVLNNYQNQTTTEDFWDEFDWVKNQQVIITNNHNIVAQGIAKGIDKNGALQLDIDNKIFSFYSGDVSLRRQ